MKKKISYALLSMALLAFAAAIIIYPERYVNRCFQGFAMWAERVLPSLFPFMVITMLFVKTGIAEKAVLPLRRVAGKLKFPPAAAACFALAVCSGYPAGSKVVSEFYENGAIAKRDCAKVAYLCSTSGPLFIIGSVGFKMFGDKLLGIKMLVAHVFAVTVVSVIIALFSKDGNKTGTRRTAPDGNALYNAFYGSVIAVCVAGGFIAFFYVVATFCADFNLFYPLEKFFNLFLDGQTSSAICMGLVETTTGCRELAAIGGKLPAAFAGFSFTFGGLSILLQQLAYLTKVGVKPLKFIGVKFIQAVICFGLLLLIA